MENLKMDEQYFLTDALTSEKNISGLYNTFASECVNTNLKKTFLDILKDNHALQTYIFNELTSRGWYSVTQAEDNKISQTRTKFENKISS